MMFGNLLIEVNSNSLFLRGNKKLSSSDNLMIRLIDILDNLNNNIHLLFICKIQRDSGKKIDSALKLVKTIDKVGEIKEFSAFKSYNEDKIVNWIKQRADLKNVKINNDAAILLVRNTGTHLRDLDTEIEKLIMYVYPEKLIKKNDVIELCLEHEDIFQLAEYWLKSDKANAALELNKLFEKDHALKIIATLQTILKKWIKIKIKAETKSPFEISRIINQHEFVIKKEISRLSSISIDKLIAFRHKLTETEYKIKSGKMEPEISLELAVIS